MKAMPVIFIVSVLLVLSSCVGGNSEDAGVSAMENESETFAIEAFGVVRVSRTRSLGIEFPATINDILVVVGDRVTNGTPLLSLDLARYRNQQTVLAGKIDVASLRLAQIESDDSEYKENSNLERAKLRNTMESETQNLEQMQQEYDELFAGILSGNDPDVRKLEVDLEQARTDLALAEEAIATSFSLHKDGFLSDRELDLEKNAVEAVRARMVGVELSIKGFDTRRRQELDKLSLAIAQKRLSLDNLQIQSGQLSGPVSTNAEIQRAQLAAYEEEMTQLLALTHLPFVRDEFIVSDVNNGIIETIHGSVGDQVTMGVKMITILDLDTLVVEAGVPEEFIKDIELGREATIKPLADSDREYPGKVTHIAGMATSRGGETVVNVILEITDRDGFLIPNMNVDIEFSTAEDAKSDQIDETEIEAEVEKNQDE